MIKKLRKRIKKYLDSPQHVRTVTLVILLIIVLSIPLTVILVQSQQDNRQRAEESVPFYGGTQTTGCGEIVVDLPKGSQEGILTYRSPASVNNQWETRKKDGGILKQEDIRNKMRSSHFYQDIGSGDIEKEITRLVPNPDPASPDYHPETITCRLWFDYDTADCKVSFVDPLQAGKSNENWLYVGDQPKDIQLKLEKNPGGTSFGQCDLEIHMHTPAGGVTPTSAQGTTPTPSITLAPTPTLTATEAAMQITGTTTCGEARAKPSLVVALPSPRGWKANDVIFFNPSLTATPGASVGDLAPYVKNNTIEFYDGYPFPLIQVKPNTTYKMYLHNIVASESSKMIEVITKDCTVTPTPTVKPTVAATPVPTMPKTPTKLTVAVSLPGIGKNGNATPNNMQRPVFLTLFDSGSKAVGASVSAVLSLQNGIFTGTANFGTVVPTGTYTVKLKMDQYLIKALASGSAITAGVTNTIPEVRLVSGDINGDNKIDILDYNILVGCFGGKINTESCGTKKVDADLNDDSLVDGVDYNLFILGLKTAKQGD